MFTFDLLIMAAILVLPGILAGSWFSDSREAKLPTTERADDWFGRNL